MAKPRVLLDVNILMDIIYRRTPWYEDAAKIFYMAEQGDIEAYMSAISVDTISYILRKNYSGAQINSIIKNLRKVLGVAAVNDTVVDHAISLKWSDLEDAIQYCSAIQSHCDLLITRNQSDYRGAGEEVRIVSPAGFLKSISI
jgi:predicted nucleic acid-binding protein